MAKLNKSTMNIGVTGPVVTIVMDGIGIAPDGAGNAVKNAYTPTLRKDCSTPPSQSSATA